MHMPKTALALTLAASAGLAMAESSRSAQYERCVARIDEGAFRQSRLASCITEELARQDATLNAEYQTLRNALSEEQRSQLVKGQRAWLRYREDWCRFDAIGLQAPGGAINNGLCLLELTDTQIDLIRNQH